MTWIIMIAGIGFALWVSKNLKVVPGRVQSIAELFINFFRDLVISSLGPSYYSYTPLIATIFIFILLCNLIGIIPNLFVILGTSISLILKIFGLTMAQIHYHNFFNVSLTIPESEWYSFLFSIPEFAEPTRYLSTDLGMGIMVAIIVHGTTIKKKGLSGYLKTYFHPVWYLFPLNIIEEIAKVTSHSLRLFGNILGGSLVLLIVSRLVSNLVVPIALQFFFGLVEGVVQAFVFTMLALTYIAIKVRD